jgi:MYXO-CTERM domain-containing protein
MSNGNQVYLNSWERIQMNFFEGCNVVTVDTSGTFEIGSINLSCNGPQVLRIKADRGKTSEAGVDFQRYYYLEYRTPVGIDKTTGVLLHYAPDLKEGGWSRCDWGGPDCPEDFIVNPISATAKEGLLTEGAAWTTPQNVGIKIVSIGETAKFEFTFPTQGDAPTCLEGKPWDNQAPVCKVPSVSDGGTQPPPGDAAPPRTDAGSGDAAPPPPDDAGATGGSGGTGGSTGGTGGATAGTGGSGGDDKGCSCRVPGSGTSNRFSAFTALAGLALAAGARRRARRPDRS